MAAAVLLLALALLLALVAMLRERRTTRLLRREAEERDRMNAELRAAQLRHRLLADNATDTILAFGPDGRVTYVSPASSELIGLRPEEIVGSQPRDFVHPDDRRTVMRARARVAEEGGTITVTSRLRHRAGHYMWIEARVRRVLDPETGVPVEGQAIVRDVSERVAAEAALRESVERIAARSTSSGRSRTSASASGTRRSCSTWPTTTRSRAC